MWVHHRAHLGAPRARELGSALHEDDPDGEMTNAPYVKAGKVHGNPVAKAAGKKTVKRCSCSMKMNTRPFLSKLRSTLRSTPQLV